MISPTGHPLQLGAGSWCWFGDPRAIHHEQRHERTYVGWLGVRGEVSVGCFDHHLETWRVTVVRDRLGVDDHGNPALALRPDGQLMVFYSAHYGRRMYYRVSDEPESIDMWQPEQRVPTNEFGPWGFTYPNPMSLPAERRLYVFWRGGARNPTFATLDLEGRWSRARTLIRVRRQRPYAKFTTNGRDEIHFAFTEAHPRNRKTSIFYASLCGGVLRGGGRREIADLAERPLAPSQADRVHDAREQGYGAWIHDIALDADGNPTLVYAVFPSRGDHRYVYARWTPSGWIVRDLVAAGGSICGDGSEPHYSGGISLRHGDPSVVVLSREVDGVHEIERWTTPDGGDSWHSEPITEASAEPNLRPIIARHSRGGHAELFWLRGSYPGYRRYQTVIATTPLIGRPPRS